MQYFIMFCILGMSVGAGGTIGMFAEAHTGLNWLGHFISASVSVTIPGVLVAIVGSVAEAGNKDMDE